MADYELPKHHIDHLRDQFQRALPILFTGAGFSGGATTIANRSTPSVSELKQELWKLCFPGEAYEDSSTLQNLYDHALLRHTKQLKELLQPLFTIRSDSLPEWYGIYFKAPWFRAYTLNIDNLPVAANAKFQPARAITYISGAPTQNEKMIDDVNSLNVICLNGTTDDLPDKVVFSIDQYADRLANRIDPWYLRLTADLLTRPFVFVGTSLDEPPLWQHVAIRRERGRDMRELRPRSYLVTPRLDRARRALLAEYNVEWVPMTADGFATTVLAPMVDAMAAGSELLRSKAGARGVGRAALPEVVELARNPERRSEYLLGQEPIWADIQSGRAIERGSDAGVWTAADNMLQKQGTKDVLLLTGTAGSGKSTTLMRLALKLVAKGLRVAWVERGMDIAARDIRMAMLTKEKPNVLAIDDADIYGTELSNLVRDIATEEPSPLIVVGMRATRIHRALVPTLLKGVSVVEKAMPPLEDADIKSLIDVLDRENRLGVLKGKPRSEQEKLFREQAGRQLLVAMIQATSGRKFEEKAVSELNELAAEEQLVYAIVTVATSFRFTLARDEIVLAAGSDDASKVLNSLDHLIRRHLLVPAQDGFIVRHRVIAEIVMDALLKAGRLPDTLRGLALLAATKVAPETPRRDRAWRMLRAIINHDFLAKAVGPEGARNLYGFLEALLAWDYHFWLQRGALEVEFGDLSLAEQFLNQASGLAGNDPFVRNEVAYMLFRKALEDPQSLEARRYVEEATSMLEELIYTRGVVDAYPYHVIGSQGLAWSKRGIADLRQKEMYLRRIEGILDDGYKRHSASNELRTLRDDVKRAILLLAVPRRARD